MSDNTVSEARDEEIEQKPQEQVSKARQVAKSTLLMTIGTLASRVMGLVRTWAMAFAIGATAVTSSYQIANNLPNIIYEVIAGGMIAAAFLPVLMLVNEQSGKDASNRYGSNILNIVFVLLGAISLLGIVFAEQVVATQTFTVEGGTEVVGLAVWFFRIFSIQILFYGLGGIIQGILNANRVFFITSLAPALNNVVTTAGFIIYAFVVGINAEAGLWILGISTTLGVVVQCVCQVPALIKCGFKWTPVIDLKDPMIMETLRISIPTIIFVAASIVSNSCRNAFSLVPTDQGPAMIFYAWMWFQLPYGVVAVSLSRTMFTEMSEAAAKNDFTALSRYISNGLSATLILIIPMAACLIALAFPLIAVFQAGAFSPQDVSAISKLLIVWALGLPFFSIFMYNYNAFASIRKFMPFALMNIVLTGVQVALYWLLTRTELGLLGIPLADMVYYIIYAIASFALLRYFVGKIEIRRSIPDLIKISIVSVIGGIVMFICLNTIMPYPSNMFWAVLDVAIVGSIGLLFMVGAAYAIRISAIREVIGRLKHRFIG